MDCSLPGSSIHEIFQARVLEWVAIAFSEIPTIYSSFPGGSLVKNLPANAEDTGSIPGWRRSAAGENGNLLIILAWKIPWTEEPGGFQSMK